MSIQEHAEKIAVRWSERNYGPRGPYTQVILPVEVADEIARIVLEEGITQAEVARRLLTFALSYEEERQETVEILRLLRRNHQFDTEVLTRLEVLVERWGR